MAGSPEKPVGTFRNRRALNSIPTVELDPLPFYGNVLPLLIRERAAFAWIFLRASQRYSRVFQAAHLVILPIPSQEHWTHLYQLGPRSVDSDLWQLRGCQCPRLLCRKCRRYGILTFHHSWDLAKMRHILHCCQRTCTSLFSKRILTKFPIRQLEPTCLVLIV